VTGPPIRSSGVALHKDWNLIVFDFEDLFSGFVGRIPVSSFALTEPINETTNRIAKRILRIAFLPVRISQQVMAAYHKLYLYGVRYSKISS
jgi:hypothetical protein